MAWSTRLKALALLFVFVFVFAGVFAVLTTENAVASRCECWVMYCTVEEPIFCWDECVPCPPFPPEWP